MKLKEANPKELQDRTERAQAKLARIARGDCWHGGARALVLAKRLTRAKFDADAVVSQAYANSRGNAESFLAYECPECGEVCMGSDAAFEHCAQTEIWHEVEEN